MHRGIVRVLTFLVAALVALQGSALAQRLTLQHIQPESHPWHLASQTFAEEVSRLTNGRVTIAIYPAGQLSQRSPETMMEQTQRGVTHIMPESVLVFGNLAPSLNVFNLPFLFDDTDHYLRVIADPPEAARKWLDELHAKDLHVISLWPRPFRQLINSKGPVERLADLQGLRIRVPGIPIAVETWRALGANTVPLASPEVYTALQLGTIDGEENPIESTYSYYRSHEVAKFETEWNYMADVLLVTIHLRTWNSLDEEAQNALVQAAAAARQVLIEENQKYEDEARAVMRQAGVQFNTITPEARAEFREAVQPVYEWMANQVGAEDLNAFLDAVRAAASE